MMAGSCAVVIEDFKLIAQAWGRMLEKSQRFSEIHIFYDASEIEQKIMELGPDLILMDVNLPNSINGIEVTQRLMKRNPQLKVIILTMHNEPVYVKKAMEAGAMGFVTKNSPIPELNIAIETVLKGEPYICNEVASSY